MRAGRFGCSMYSPLRNIDSARLSPSALTPIWTSPFPGGETSSCSIFRTSGPPVSWNRTTRAMAFSSCQIEGCMSLGLDGVFGDGQIRSQTRFKRHYACRRPYRLLTSFAQEEGRVHSHHCPDFGCGHASGTLVASHFTNAAFTSTGFSCSIKWPERIHLWGSSSCPFFDLIAPEHLAARCDQGSKRYLISALAWRSAAWVEGTSWRALSRPKSWICPMSRVEVTSTPASRSLRP